MSTFIYFDLQHAIKTHDYIIEKSGGRTGVLDSGKVDSVLEHIQNDFYYPELEDKITHLVFSINKLHAFNDGNKRTSIALGAYFLEINGIDYCIDKFIIGMENFAVYIADNLISKELLYEIISSILFEEEFNEQLKLKIINALN